MYDKWHPRVKTGFFYVGDQQWYLFADKQVLDMNKVTWYEFDLGVEIENIIEAKYGTQVLDPSDVVVDDTKVRVRFEVSALAHVHDFLLQYTLKAVSSGRVVQTAQTHVALPVTNAVRRIFLNPIPPEATPVIFTDTAVVPHSTNTSSHSIFDVDYYTGEVTFLGVDKNKLWNANFSARANDTYQRPADWDTHTDTLTFASLYQTGQVFDRAIVCGNIVGHDGVFTTLQEAQAAYQAGLHVINNYLAQQAPLEDNGTDYTLSFYAKKWQHHNKVFIEDQKVTATIAWVDNAGNFLDGDGDVIATTIQGLLYVIKDQYLNDSGLLGALQTFSVGDDWERHQITASSPPSNAFRAIVLLSGQGTPLVESVQLEENPEATPFTFAPRTGFFEYEGSNDGYAVIDTIDLNPANEMRVTGILNIATSNSIDVERELY